MTAAEKAKIAHRIRSLLTKTVENGCTEEEAISAAQLARKLMDDYRISQTDLEIQKEEVVWVEWSRSVKTSRAASDECMTGIAAYCGVKMFYNSRSGETKAVAFGLKSDVEFAQYLYAMIRGSLGSERKAAIKRKEITNTTATRWSFVMGMSVRVNRRLLDMAAALDGTAKTGSGTALVVVRNAVVTDAWAKLNLQMGKSRMTGKAVSDGDAWAKGDEAGKRVNLSRPLRGSKAAGQIGNG